MLKLEIREVTNYVPGPSPGVSARVWEVRRAGNTVAVLFDPSLQEAFQDFNEEFVRQAIKSEAPYDQSAQARLVKYGRLLHAVMGMETETGELMDMLKKHIFYNKEFDRVNAKEEIGDLLWYVALASDEIGIPITLIMERVIAKLKARYGGKFSQDKANNRDLSKERQVLEEGQ